MRTRTFHFLVVTLAASLVGCRDCEQLDNTAPQGSIDPPIFDFGPLAKGSECQAIVEVVNQGQSNLDVTGALEDTVGDWTLQKVPTLVELRAREQAIVDYVANGDVGDREATTLVLQTNDPDEGGVIRGVFTALIIEENGPVAKSRCNNEAGDAEISPCTELAFGAVQINQTGRTLFVVVVNDGTADLVVNAATSGNAEFQILDPLVPGTRDAQIGTGEQRAFPVTVPPGRSSECGADSGQVNLMFIPVLYSPAQVGADVDSLFINTTGLEADGAPGGLLEVPMSGIGSDTGILITPDTIVFGTVPEGETATEEVRVSNFGTSSASVNISCIDLENDGTCEARCTGAAADTAHGGTLTCDVTKADGSNEGDGFVLAPTDAQQDGDDERLITVTFAPIAGFDSIPSTAVLALQSNILGNRTFTAPLLGVALGQLTATVENDQCPDGVEGVVCVQAAGDPGDTQTWTGSVTVTLTNVGTATVNISEVVKDESQPTIADDYTFEALASTQIAPNASVELVINYANNDFSTQDPLNFDVIHDGAGSLTRVPVDVVPPQ